MSQSSPSPFRVVAMVSAYNEEDVIGKAIGDLVAQGIDVYLLDHGSTDATAEEARPYLGRGLVRIERFPEESGGAASGGDRYAWRSILRRKEQLASQLEATWFLHHDADELREGPWDGVGLKEAIARVDAAGYTAIDFKVFDFVPTHDRYGKGDDLRRSFTHYRPGAGYDRLQIKCWKNTSVPVDLSATGGHEVRFEGRRIFPVRFVLRHYPVRTQAQGERKIFKERLPRYDPQERAEGWHVQYDKVAPGTSFIASEEALTPFDLAQVRTELLVENRELESTREELEALKHRLTRAEAEAGALNIDLAWFRKEWPVREAELLRTEAELGALRAELQRREAELGALNADLAMARKDLAAEQARVNELLASLSWRLMAPARAVLRRLRGY